MESCSEPALRLLERAQTVQTERARLLRLTIRCCCQAVMIRWTGACQYIEDESSGAW